MYGTKNITKALTVLSTLLKMCWYVTLQSINRTPQEAYLSNLLKLQNYFNSLIDDWSTSIINLLNELVRLCNWVWKRLLVKCMRMFLFQFSRMSSDFSVTFFWVFGVGHMMKLTLSEYCKVLLYCVKTLCHLNIMCGSEPRTQSQNINNDQSLQVLKVNSLAY